MTVRFTVTGANRELLAAAARDVLESFTDGAFTIESIDVEPLVTRPGSNRPAAWTADVLATVTN